MRRYLVLLWDPQSLAAQRTLDTLDVESTLPAAQWAAAYEGPGIRVLQFARDRDTAQTYRLQDRAGVVLGRLFDRRHADYSMAATLCFDASETRKILNSAGQHLIERYWGSYLAIVHDRAHGAWHVFRDPVGTLPCYRISHAGVEVFCSHIEDCARLLQVAFSIDRTYLARWLIYSSLTTMQTGLRNVEQLPAGERLTLSQGNISRTRIWNPVALALQPNFAPPDAAGKALRATVQNAVNAWASCYRHITLRLSGGLDSSIIAGCLAQAPCRTVTNYLNQSIDAGFDQERFHQPGLDWRVAEKLRAIVGQGDERHFARLVAQRWNSELIESPRSLSMDLHRLWQVPLRTSPGLYFTRLDADDAELELVRTRGSQAFFSGQAGDSVLLATRQPLAAMDYAYLHGCQRGLWQQLVATSCLSRDSLWSVLGKALSHGILRRPYAAPVSVLDRPTLLDATLAGGLTKKDFASPLAELAARAGLPPGKQNHVRGVAWSAYYDFVFHSGQYADHIDPLNSQPVWEYVLQLPVYTMLAGGVSRGLARQAFADLLPPQIRKRQVKGTGGPFYRHLVQRNRALLRESLLDGLLVQERYLDRRKLAECLSADDPSLTISASVLMCYLAAEIWLQQWHAFANAVTHSRPFAAPATCASAETARL
ncbi:MAG: asparagine synthase-related protein [Pseudomonadota bacterium]|nr:asparagine synthase-related protein [Pseudomonadota bacterium]